MNNLYRLALACGFAALSIPTSAVIAQDNQADQELQLQEIIVTGRKREESLTDVPVSISVWSEAALKEAGILNQQDLFDATVGLHFDTILGDRNSSAPAVRGVLNKAHQYADSFRPMVLVHRKILQ